MKSPGVPPLPERIGPYRILGELGRGGMGVVYSAEDPRLRRRVAIKTLPEGLSWDPARRARFEREAQLLAAMNHPNIATIHSLEEADGVHFLTMELVEGETLGTRIGGRPVPVDEILSIGRQIANALEAAHRKGVVHRDLKPGNVKLTVGGDVKILDFGIAKAVFGKGEIALPVAGRVVLPEHIEEETVVAAGHAPGTPGGTDTTLPGDILGTPGYMSPEQVRGADVDHRADIWAFGCVLYECVSGRRPFRASNVTEVLRATLSADASLGELPAETPERLRGLIERCLCKDREARLPSIALARQEIEEEIAQRALPAAASGRRRAATGPNNLPARLTSFVGRTAPLETVQGLLREQRLVTVTGTGGSGKTRVALEACWNALPRFADGAWSVELAPLSDGGLVAEAVSAVLSVRESPGRTSVETLVEHLAAKELLLLVDNCEHVLDGVRALVERVLAGCPGVRILATSRQALGLPEEAAYHLPLLEVPAGDDGNTVQGLVGLESVRLFVERARAARADFALTEQNAGEVARICRRLDGIPLALELAAARVKVMAVHEIASRLADRFRLLGSRDQTLAHHQTLRALIDWSYDHLALPEQALFRRLAAFAGGWTLDATEAVCAGGDVEEWEILDLLTELVDRSLVESDTERSQGTDRARFRMLETVREYALARLDEHDEARAVRERHRAYFLALAEQAEPGLTGAEQTTWLLRLAADHDNLREAVASGGDGGGEEALRLAGALGRYWAVRGHWSEGRRVTAALLERTKDVPPSASRAKVLHWAGNLAYRQGDYAKARSLHEEALAARRAVGDRAGEAASLESLGVVAHGQGRLDESLGFLERSLGARRELGDEWAVALSLNNLGVAVEAAGHYEHAVRFHEESLQLRRRLGDASGISGSLNNLGCALECLGDYARARELHEEALALRRKLGDRWGVGLSLKNLGAALFALGDLDGARGCFRESVDTFCAIEERYEMCHALAGLANMARASGESEEAASLARECLEIRRALGEPRGIANSLECFAGLAVDAGDAGRAARLLGAAAALREKIRAPLPPPERAQVERDTTAARELAPGSFVVEHAAGGALDADGAAAFALESRTAARLRVAHRR
jgi:non-specific serine/threonine protein kinase